MVAGIKPNIYFDFSGWQLLYNAHPEKFYRMLRTVIDEVGPWRVLFGTDAYPPVADAYEVAFRFLETDDESFDYAPGEEVPPQGRWQISGAALPADLLAGVYAGNAARVLGL